MLSLADKYVLLSKKFIPLLKNTFNIDASEKTVAIENPITIEGIHEYPKEKTCIFIGRLASQKGLDKLIKIWANIESKYPKWKLQIVGDGPLREKVERDIAKYKLKKVEIVGFTINVVKHLKKASILCMTSIFEGWGLVLMEAMACGVVPIAFNSFIAAKEIIDHEINGFLIPPFNINEYCIQLSKLIEDENNRHNIAFNAYRSSSRFSIEKVTNKWETLFSTTKTII